KVSGLMPLLPVGTDPPKVEKFNLDAAPVLTIAVSGKRNLREVTEIAKKLIKEDLEGVTGVGAVVLVGGQTPAVDVTVDPVKRRGRELSAEDVRLALVRQNLELPGGKVDGGPREEVLRTIGRVPRVKDFEDIIIATRDGKDGGRYSVKVKDVARVEDGLEEPRGMSRLDGGVAGGRIGQKESGGDNG